jgi:hypothetical protein
VTLTPKYKRKGKLMPNDHTETVVLALPTCNLCEEAGYTEPALYDAHTTMGPWAYLCQEHFDDYGIGLGLGQGQKLVLDATETEPTLDDAMRADVADILGLDISEVEL